MKKSFFAMGMIALALGSCSNEPIEGPNGGNENADGREVIKLGLASSRADVSVEGGARNTRGGGTVGSMDEENNNWCYEDLYVLMTTTNPDGLDEEDATWGFTSFKGTLLTKQFDGTFISRPDAQASTAGIDYKCGANKADKYYPINKEVTSNFFVFHVDDAFDKSAGTDPTITMNDDATAMTVDFTIDGSQDLMVGMADNDGAGYSCATARQGVIPTIPMQHLLTRFTFMLKSGSKSAEGVKVKAIRVYSKTKGTMTVAYNAETAPDEFITWKPKDGSTDEYDYSALTLQTKDADQEASLDNGKPSLVDFADELVYTMTTAKASVPVGDALLVSPGDNEYRMEVDLEYTVEYMNGRDKADGQETITNTQSLTLDLDKAGTFQAGSSYNVIITVYGIEKISANVTLSKWVDGGNIGVGADNDPTWPEADGTTETGNWGEDTEEEEEEVTEP